MFINLTKKDSNPVDIGDILLARQEETFHCFIFFVEEEDNENINIQWLLDIETGGYIKFDMNNNEEAEDIFDYIENNQGIEILEIIHNNEIIISKKDID